MVFHIGKYCILKTDKTSKIEFNKDVSIGDYVKILSENDGNIILGKSSYIGDYSTIRATRATIIIGNNTMIAQNVKLISTNHYYKKRDQLIVDQDIDTQKKGILIGDDCWLGAACIILPGVTVGNGVVIGANSVVTKSLEDYSIAVGNPAKVISYRK